MVNNQLPDSQHASARPLAAAAAESSSNNDDNNNSAEGCSGAAAAAQTGAPTAAGESAREALAPAASATGAAGTAAAGSEAEGDAGAGCGADASAAQKEVAAAAASSGAAAAGAEGVLKWESGWGGDAGSRRSFFAWLANIPKTKGSRMQQRNNIFDALELLGRRQIAAATEGEAETLVPLTGVRHVLQGIFQRIQGNL